MRLLNGEEKIIQLRSKLLGERFETYRFLKKSLLVGVDVKPDFLSNSGASDIKGLVGGDWFNAEKKGGNGLFPMQGRFNLLITTNVPLRVNTQGEDDADAWRRRMRIVRNEAEPPKKKIPGFAEYLIRTEGSGILNWALLGAQKVLNEMPDEGGNYQMTPRQGKIVDDLLAESQSVRHFLVDRVIKAPAKDLTVKEIVEAYAAYCPSRDWQALSPHKVQGKLLDGLMLELFGVANVHDIQRNDKDQRGFSGVTFNK